MTGLASHASLNFTLLQTLQYGDLGSAPYPQQDETGKINTVKGVVHPKYFLSLTP